jgi:hypothetical protein
MTLIEVDGNCRGVWVVDLEVRGKAEQVDSFFSHILSHFDAKSCVS